MAESVTCSIKHQARALSSVTSDKQFSKWIVGTNSLREENEVRILLHDIDHEALKSYKTFIHQNEIWDIASCPSSEDMFITLWSKVGVSGATLWRGHPDSGELSAISELTGPQSGAILRRILWHPTDAALALTVEEGALRRWNIGESNVECVASASPGELAQLWSAALGPSSPTLVAAAAEKRVQLWDLQSMTKTGEIAGAHHMPVRDVSFSPSAPHLLVSAGDDCIVRVWDIRTLGAASPTPLVALAGHDHWVWRATFCPAHSSLLASSSSDARVCCWHVPDLEGSSVDAAAGRRVGSVGGSRETEFCVATYDEHADSVYGLAWSVVDPWSFASLSYDGHVVVNKVPKNTKYKVLL